MLSLARTRHSTARLLAAAIAAAVDNGLTTAVFDVAVVDSDRASSRASRCPGFHRHINVYKSRHSVVYTLNYTVYLHSVCYKVCDPAAAAAAAAAQSKRVCTSVCAFAVSLHACCHNTAASALLSSSDNLLYSCSCTLLQQPMHSANYIHNNSRINTTSTNNDNDIV
jgi:hypothetical protein